MSILLGRTQSWPSRVQTLCGEQRTAAICPCRDKSGVKKGYDMKEVLQDARDVGDAGAARSSNERVGDFALQESHLRLTIMILNIDKQSSVTGGNWRPQGMLDVQRRCSFAQARIRNAHPRQSIIGM